SASSSACSSRYQQDNLRSIGSSAAGGDIGLSCVGGSAMSRSHRKATKLPAMMQITRGGSLILQPMMHKNASNGITWDSLAGSALLNKGSWCRDCASRRGLCGSVRAICGRLRGGAPTGGALKIPSPRLHESDRIAGWEGLFKSFV